jgi:hypothetical protein
LEKSAFAVLDMHKHIVHTIAARRLFVLIDYRKDTTMKQYTTSTHLTRTIHQLEHILAGETYPAIRAAEVMAITLLELAEVLREEEEQIMERNRPTEHQPVSLAQEATE